MGPLARLAVVEFGGRRFLIAVSRGRVDTIAETPAPNFALPDE
jgi:flagellar protein FliO/FliZ